MVNDSRIFCVVFLPFTLYWYIYHFNGYKRRLDLLKESLTISKEIPAMQTTFIRLKLKMKNMQTNYSKLNRKGAKYETMNGYKDISYKDDEDEWMICSVLKIGYKMEHVIRILSLLEHVWPRCDCARKSSHCFCYSKHCAENWGKKWFK